MAASTATPVASSAPSQPRVRPLSIRQLNFLRVGYAVLGVGLALTRWPLVFDAHHMSLAKGTVECLFVGLSVLALLGLRHPRRMLPILLFEVTWKLVWLLAVALPRWSDHTLNAAATRQTSTVLLVVIFIAVIPWRYVLNQYVLSPGEA